MINRKIQLVLLIGIALILLPGCAISKDKISPTGAVIINTNLDINEKITDIIIKTNEIYKNMQDFKASKTITDDNGVMEEEIMIKGGKYKIYRESFENENGWYVKNKITEISNGNKVKITKTFELGNITEVEEILENEVILDPNEFTYTRLGTIYNSLGKAKEAEEMFKMAISSLNPNHHGFFELGLLYKNQGRIEEAEEVFRNIANWRLKTMRVKVGKILPQFKDYFKNNWSMKVWMTVRKIKEVNPDYHGQNIDIGEIDENDLERKIEVAEEIFKNALEIIPNNEEFYLELGAIYRFQDDIKKAEKMYNKVLTINPFNERALIELSNVYMSQGEFEEARATFEKILNADPNNIFTHISLGALSLYQRDEKEAEIAFKKAIDIDPSNDMTYHAIGEFYLFFDIKKAEEMLEKAINLKSDDEELYEKLGWIYLNQGRVVEAEEMFRKFIITELPTHEVREVESYDEIQYINDILDFNQYNFILKQNKNFYFLEGKKMKNTALWGKIKAEINKDDFSVTKLEFYKEIDGKEKLVKSIIYEKISFNNNFDEKEFAIIGG